MEAGGFCIQPAGNIIKAMYRMFVGEVNKRIPEHIRMIMCIR